MGDYHVDRLQVYNRNVEPSNTNRPIASLSALLCLIYRAVLFTMLFLFLPIVIITYSGGYSDRVPPLPIPNREVKPVSVDGTAFVWESRSPPFLKEKKAFA